jgi:hypothetical protein
VSRIAAIAVLVGFAGASSAAAVTRAPLGQANGVVGIYYNKQVTDCVINFQKITCREF